MAVAVAMPPRPLRGSRLANFYPPIPESGPSLSACDSAFQLQEYIAMLIRHNPHDVEKIVNIPSNARVVNSDERNDDAGDKDGKEVVVDEACWIYEHLRRLAQDLSHPLITTLQNECTRTTCPEMKAGEWLYLCVAHGNDGAMEHCCAIDYIIHTLDSATALLNSPRAFPSRLSIPSASLRHFSSLARRLGRIFAHAYFHHREAFEAAEAETSLYARFLALTMRFSLVPAEFLVVPPRMANLIPGASGSVGLSAERESLRGSEKPGAEQPRLLNASLEIQQRQQAQASDKPSDTPGAHEVIDVSPEHSNRAWSPEKPGASIIANASPGGQDSPRKMGRSRTDTMVHSDFMAFSEELKGASTAGHGSGLGINLPASGTEGGRYDEHPEHDDGQGGLRSGWDEVSLDAGADEHGQEEGEHEEHGGDSEDADQGPPEADINSDPLQPSPFSDEAATVLHHPYQTSTQGAEDSSKSEPAETTTTPAPTVIEKDIAPTVSPLEDATDLPLQNELIILAQSSEICSSAPSASEDNEFNTSPASTSDSQAAAHPSDPFSDSSSVPSEHHCTAALDKPDNDVIGPGGFILLGEPGIMCKVSDGNCGMISSTEASSEEKFQDKEDEKVQDKEDEKGEDKKVDVDEKGVVETDGKEQDAEKKEGPTGESEESIANVSINAGDVSLLDPNVTLEEDLRDVERVLRE